MTDRFAAALTDSLPAMLRFARALTRDAAAADDLVQDAVVRAIERRDRYDPGRDLSAWLLTVVHNLFVDGWRREKRGQVMKDSFGGPSQAAPAQEHAAALGQALRAFQALPDDQRAVMHLVVVEGLSYGETASLLNIPAGTVMSRLSRARRALREPRVQAARPFAPHLSLVSDRDG